MTRWRSSGRSAQRAVRHQRPRRSRDRGVHRAREVRALAGCAPSTSGWSASAWAGADFPDVGPQRAMPSGGLVAMGNLRAFARDLGPASWAAGAPARFSARGARALRGGGRGRRRVRVLLARLARAPLAFVGTAKSVYVAPYGPGERGCWARPGGSSCATRRPRPTCAPTACGRGPGQRDRRPAGQPERVAWRAPLRLALLPGSRERAYADALRIAAAVAACASGWARSTRCFRSRPTSTRPASRPR